ncbi:hypothetical protein FRB99_004756 [Tulasnella sp. 403]|nr:hypothetical protein FRB99_004756 [Tulasnella sp. 403]
MYSASSNPSNNATAILQELKETRSVGRATVIDRAKLQFDAGSKIGSGRFGTLFRATLLDDTTPPNTTLVAARRLLPASGDQHANRQHTEMVNKADKWSDLNNPNIAKFVGYYPSGPAVSREFLLVFSYVSGSHLVEYLERESPDYVRRINLATDVAQGLLYLHTRSPPIRHGNLHPRNILVESDGRALLCDYDLEGLAGEATEVNQQTMETLRYKSPEELRTIPKPVLRSDIWSFGSVFLTIITSQVPYGNVAIDKSKLIEVASQRIPPADIDNLGCPSRAQNVLGICWKWDPESRPPPNELVSILSGRLCRFTEVWNIPADGLRFSQDGKYLAVGYGKSIKIYNAESGVLVLWVSSPFEMKGSNSQFRLHSELGVPVAKLVAMQFSRSGRFLAVSTVDYTVALWDLATHDFKGELKGHTDIIWTLDMSFDDSCVVSGSYDRTIRVWVIDGQEIPTRTIPTDLEVECLTTHPNSHIMAVSLDEGGAQVRSLLTGQVLVALDPPDTTFALHFSPDGRSLYGGCYGGHMCHWDIGSILQQPPAENSSDKGSISYTALRQVKGVIVLEPIWVITTSSKWFVAIDGEGSVWALNLQPKGTTPQVIGKIDSVRPRE